MTTQRRKKSIVFLQVIDGLSVMVSVFILIVSSIWHGNTYICVITYDCTRVWCWRILTEALLCCRYVPPHAQHVRAAQKETASITSPQAKNQGHLGQGHCYQGHSNQYAIKWFMSGRSFQGQSLHDCSKYCSGRWRFVWFWCTYVVCCLFLQCVVLD